MSTVQIVFTGLMAIRPELNSNQGPHWRLGIFHGESTGHQLSIHCMKKRAAGAELVPFYLPDKTSDIEFKVANHQVTVTPSKLQSLFHLDGAEGHPNPLPVRPNGVHLQSFKLFVSDVGPKLLDKVCVTQGPPENPTMQKEMEDVGTQIVARVELTGQSSAVLTCDKRARSFPNEQGTDYIITVTNLPPSIEDDSFHVHQGSHFRLYYLFWGVEPQEQLDVWAACPRLLTESTRAALEAQKRLKLRIDSGTGSRPCIPPLITQSDFE
jgi:hypothetical protein